MKKGHYFSIQFFLFFIFGAFFTPIYARGGEQERLTREVIVQMRENRRVFPIKVRSAESLDDVIAGFLQRKDVEVAEENFRFSLAAFPNDPWYGQQWYLENIRARDAWSQELVVRETTKIGREAVIAVLDTGVDIDHPDIKQNVWLNPGEVAQDGIDNDNNGYIDDVHGWDFIDDTSDPRPKFGANYNKTAVSHGTIISGIASAVSHNAEGISGVSWHSKIMPLRVLDSQGNGNVLNVYKAIQYAIKNRADVINMSFVGDDDSELLSEAIKSAYAAGIIVVAAAGNSDPAQTGVNFEIEKKYPVCSSVSESENYVMGVASLDASDKKTSFTNFGDNCIDISAPGVNIFGLQVYRSNNSDFSKYYSGPWSGTSLSAPMVSGTVALIKTLRPDLTQKQIIQAVLGSAKKLEARQGLGQGKLNVFDSLASALKERVGILANAPPEENFLVATLGFESFPQLKVVKFSGQVFKSFFPYSPTFRGPINVAVGNVDRDEPEEIVTGAGLGGGAHVKVFDIEGKLESQFFAFDKSKRSGVNVAAGDVNGDGIEEIIAAPGRGLKPEVRVFTKEGKLLYSFLAYGEKFFGGVNVAAGDVNGDGTDEIVTGAGFGGGPHVRIFDKEGTVLKQFFAFNADSRGGVRVSLGDLNNDIFEEIVASVESSAGPVMRVYRTTDFSIISEFFAFSPDYFYGVYSSVGDFDSDGSNEILVGSGVGGGSQVKAFDWKGNIKKQLQLHIDSYKGGVRTDVLHYRYK